MLIYLLIPNPKDMIALRSRYIPQIPKSRENPLFNRGNGKIETEYARGYGWLTTYAKHYLIPKKKPRSIN